MGGRHGHALTYSRRGAIGKTTRDSHLTFSLFHVCTRGDAWPRGLTTRPDREISFKHQAGSLHRLRPLFSTRCFHFITFKNPRFASYQRRIPMQLVAY